MDTVYGIVVFSFGLIIGSFLNVIICRYNTGATFGGRSLCLSCGTPLGWRELIPVVSFLVRRGRCAFCHSRISWQYPIVELLTGLLFLLAFHLFGFRPYLFFICFELALLVVIGVYDIRHKIIPDRFVYLFSFLALVEIFLEGGVKGFETETWSRIAAGPLLSAPFAALWYYSRGRWMGLGDAKLALGMGWLLGMSRGFIAVTLAFWVGAVASILLIIFSRLPWFRHGRRKVTIKSEIPFGPFLIFGTIVEIFFSAYVSDVVSLFMW